MKNQEIKTFILTSEKGSPLLSENPSLEKEGKKSYSCRDKKTIFVILGFLLIFLVFYPKPKWTSTTVDPVNISKLLVTTVTTKSANATAGIAGAPHIFPTVGKKGRLATAITYKLQYHSGCSVMANPIKVHVIYYGNFSIKQKSLVSTFLKGLGISKWWNLSKKYYQIINRKKSFVSQISRGTVTVVPATKTELSDNDIANIVYGNIRTPSQNDIHLVLSDRYSFLVMTTNIIPCRTVKATSGLCSDYCGWHNYYSVSSKKIAFAYVGSPIYCPSACSTLSPDGYNAPNGDFEMDSMLSIIAHEITEAATDPYLDCWYDAVGFENADKCAWNFGLVKKNGLKKYSEVVGSGKFYLQTNWDIGSSPQKCRNGY